PPRIRSRPATPPATPRRAASASRPATRRPSGRDAARGRRATDPMTAGDATASGPDPPPGAPYAFVPASCSHVGMVRGVTEDACRDRPDLGLWAVADGMGGHDAGDVASRLVVEGLARVPPPPAAAAFLRA